MWMFLFNTPDYTPFVEVASALSSGAVAVSLIIGVTMILCAVLKRRK